MNYTLEELERMAWISGDTERAELYARLMDLEAELEEKENENG